MRQRARDRSRRPTSRLAVLAAVVAGGVAVSGCDILEVENPNNIVEENLDNVAAAEAIVNGALSTVAHGIGEMAVPYAAASDELFWIGSRDAWLQLDQGILTDPANEFSDAAFPFINEGRWMADEAVERLEGFVEEFPEDPNLKIQRARAYLIAGLAYTHIADMFDDFTFSDKQDAAPPVGKANMFTVYDQAIQYLDLAQADATPGSDLDDRIIATRMRAHHGRAVWNKIIPTISDDPLVNDAGANADAMALIEARGGEDWAYELTYSGTTVSNAMGEWINQRSELQFGGRYVSNGGAGAPNDITGVSLLDPIDGTPAPIVQHMIIDVFSLATDFPPLRVASVRGAYLILAEAALATGDMDGFTTWINELRALDGLTPYSGQVDARELLEYSRMSNLVLQNRRLADMYRFGIVSGPDNCTGTGLLCGWQPGSDALARPGTFLPITITEIRSNPHLSG